MNRYTLVLYEAGLRVRIPALEQTSSCDFPLWGNYYFPDFTLSSFASDDLVKRIVLEREYRRLSSFIGSRWGRDRLQLVSLSKGITEFIDLIRSDNTEIFILGTISSVVYFPYENLLPVLESMKGDQLKKISVDGVPTDFFVVGKNRLVQQLRSSASRERPQSGFGPFLFDHILHTSFDIMENIPGKVLFQNNLMQLYRTNLDILKLQRDQSVQDVLVKLDRRGEEKSLSYIAEDASVQGSYISSGVEIHGQVINSILFQGVSVMPKTRIVSSVIMNNNQIGKDVEISNTLILPYRKEVMKGNTNLSQGSIIGGNSNSTANENYPDQIHSGITVLGMDTEIPPRFKVESGCYVGGKIKSGHFKKEKKLGRGNSYISEVSTA